MLTHHLTRPALGGLAILAIAVSACGSATVSSAPTAAPSSSPAAAEPTPSATAASTAPDASASAAAVGPQTGHIQVPDKGFGVTLPDGWQSLPVDAAALQQVVDSLPADSEMRGVLESQMGSGALQQIAFWAFDFRPGSGTSTFTRNMNVIVQPPSTFDLSLVESTVKAQLGTLKGIGAIESKMVTLPTGEALRLDYALSVPAADGTTTSVATTQYYVQLPKATLIISFTAEAGAKDAQADFDAIIGTLEAIS